MSIDLHANRVAHLRRYYRPLMEGYVYVIQFSSGMTKVGHAKDLNKRLAQHEKEARNHAVTISYRWSSPAHTGWVANERALINFCAEQYGQAASGNEYFMGADFAELVEYAQTLAFEPLTQEALDAAVQTSMSMESTFGSVQHVEPEVMRGPWMAARLTDDQAAVLRHQMARDDWQERKAEKRASRQRHREQEQAYLAFIREQGTPTIEISYDSDADRWRASCSTCGEFTCQLGGRAGQEKALRARDIHLAEVHDESP